MSIDFLLTAFSTYIRQPQSRVGNVHFGHSAVVVRIPYELIILPRLMNPSIRGQDLIPLVLESIEVLLLPQSLVSTHHVYDL